MNKFVLEGVFYEEKKVRLFPCKAIEGSGKVIPITLSDILFLPKEDIVVGLGNALSHFGNVLDLGLHYERRMGWFMGSGYAVLQ